MANDESVLKEVDQELADERQWAMFRKYGPAAIGLSVAVVIAVGGWQLWHAQNDAAAKAEALEFRNAVELLEEDPSGGREALATVAEEHQSGYAILASFQRAASFARDGERAAAISAFRKIYQDNGAPKRLRDLARLRAAYLSLDDGRDQVLEHLGELPDAVGPFTANAQEIAGLAALGAEDYETALSIFRGLSINIEALASVRARAEEFAALAASGKAGVNITGEMRVDDLLGALGEPAANDATQDDHEGHAHGETDGEEGAQSQDDAAEGAELETETSAEPAESENE